MVTFRPPLAGAATELSLSLALSVRVSAGDAISLYLPGFTGPAVGNTTSLGGASGMKFVAVWTSSCPDSTLTLILTESQTIGASSPIAVVIPASLG